MAREMPSKGEVAMKDPLDTIPPKKEMMVMEGGEHPHTEEAMQPTMELPHQGDRVGVTQRNQPHQHTIEDVPTDHPHPHLHRIEVPPLHQLLILHPQAGAVEGEPDSHVPLGKSGE